MHRPYLESTPKISRSVLRYGLMVHGDIMQEQGFPHTSVLLLRTLPFFFYVTKANIPIQTGIEMHIPVFPSGENEKKFEQLTIPIIFSSAWGNKINNK